MPVIFDPATVRPGDIYQHHFGNDQSYGYSIPVKTSRGWDLIDTYQLGMLSCHSDENSEQASIRRVIELASTPHDHYVNRCTSNFYHRNASLGVNRPRSDYELVCNLTELDVVSDREADDYESDQVVRHIPLYFEQNFSWGKGRTMGLTFVRKGAVPSLERKLRAFLLDIETECGVTPNLPMVERIMKHDVDPLVATMQARNALLERDRLRYNLARKTIDALAACCNTVTQAQVEYRDALRALETDLG